eukprot:3695410-Pyramimonas_sp.AAC.1
MTPFSGGESAGVAAGGGAHLPPQIAARVGPGGPAGRRRLGAARGGGRQSAQRPLPGRGSTLEGSALYQVGVYLRGEVTSRQGLELALEFPTEVPLQIPSVQSEWIVLRYYGITVLRYYGVTVLRYYGVT